jgi:hypothetical protein
MVFGETLTLDKKRTVYVSGAIRGNGFATADAILHLSKKSTDPVYLVINSPGGSVFVGMQILSAMEIAKTRGVVFKCLVPMAAASMAFIIYNECNERYALGGSLFLWHGIRTSMRGSVTIKDLTVTLADLRRFAADFDARLLDGLNIRKRTFYYHYHNESWLPAPVLDKMSPEYFTIVDDVVNMHKKVFTSFYGGRSFFEKEDAGIALPPGIELSK